MPQAKVQPSILEWNKIARITRGLSIDCKNISGWELALRNRVSSVLYALILQYMDVQLLEYYNRARYPMEELNQTPRDLPQYSSLTSHLFSRLTILLSSSRLPVLDTSLNGLTSGAVGYVLLPESDLFPLGLVEGVLESEGEVGCSEAERT